MYLHDNLQVCLYALESWYPNHIVDINSEIIKSSEIPLVGWKASEGIKILAMMAPQLLEARAEMIISHGECAIYLPDISATIPLCIIHCQGKIPPHISDGEKWLRQKQPHLKQSATNVSSPAYVHLEHS
ncbi:hypothetical protein [Dictyobacter arantiisoli]|uniref:Uncharacterized protein n=1 Tax=Dictyobacter arantiisoli TaxID=2014874 RepID=A0A5A5TBF1_9CHLR|nr:hypothetical protein [Dictyobacter arantiisoli]GCF08687.1 hypothetical protein KDI_22510 [Dictyobacter arantiisoli]